MNMLTMNVKIEANEVELGQFYYICKNKQLKVEEWLLHNLSILNKRVSSDSPTFPGYTALHFAVICKNLRAVKVLLEREADFTIKNAKGQTALHLAMKMILLDKAPKRKHNLIPIIDEILVAHKKYYANVLDNMGLSHFHIACFRNNYSIVLGFLENKVDFNSCISHSSSYWPGYTPLHIASRYSILSTANLLLQFGADVNMKNAAGLTPLHIALKKCDGLLVESLFSALGQNSVNPIDNDGISLLHAYCMANYNYNGHSLEDFLQQITQVNISIKSDSVLWPGYTPLHVAVHCKCTYPIVLLLKHKADINAKDIANASPFQLAIRKNLITNRFIYYIHENIKEILQIDEYSSKLFQFYCACMNSNLDCIRFFLSHGFSINTAMPSIFHIHLFGYTALHFAVELGNLEMIDFLLKNGADSCVQDANGSTPLHLAVYKKDYSIVNRMFSYYTETVTNPVDYKGLSHLHIACLDNRTAIVKNILDSSAIVDIPTSIGKTPLHFAVEFNRTEIVELLLDRNADFTLQETNTGSTPLHIAIKKQSKEITSMILSVHDRKIVNPVDNLGISHFHIFCMKNETVLINQFLQNKLANNDSVKLDSPIYPGFAPLHFAVKNGCIETVKILLNSNFDISTKDAFNKVPLHYIDKLRPSECKQILDAFWLVIENSKTKLEEETGLSALHVACMRDDSLVVEYLLHGGLDINAHTSQQCPTYSGFSPLHLAVKHNNIQIIKVLLRNGADVNVKDKYGFSPLHLACSNAKLEIVEILLANNADPTMKSARGLTTLRLALQSKNERIVQLILSHPSSMRNNPMDNKGLTYFHIACLRGMTKVVRDYIHCGANLDEPIHPFAAKYSGYTPLHIAVHKKNRQMIDLILGNWTKINIRNREGCTALHLTCTARAAHSDMAHKLLLYGADPDARNILGYTLVELAIKYNRADILEVAFKHKADPNLVSPTTMNYRPVELAIALQREKILGLLLKNGAGVHFRSMEGGTLIHQTIQLVQAKESYYTRIFSELMEHGCDLNATDNSGRTALHRSYWPVNLAALKALLRCGANIDLEDRSCRTIVSYFFEISTSRMPRLELYDIFRKHLQVRKLAGFPLSRTNELLYERLLEEHQNYLKEENEQQREEEEDQEGEETSTLASVCAVELERMKSTHFGGYVSLYEMLKNVNKMARHLARNGALVRLVKSNRLAELFPETGCLVMMQYGRALTRKDLLQPALEALHTLINENFDEFCWNLQCSDAVIDYLNNADLCSLAAAVHTD